MEGMVQRLDVQGFGYDKEIWMPVPDARTRVKKLKKDKVGSGSWVYLKFLRTLFEAKASIEPEEFIQCP